jgi:hypothetical protein
MKKMYQMDNSYDLLIQDFVTTNKLVNQTVTWDTLVSRRFENGRRKFLQYKGDRDAVIEHIDMYDGEWVVIHLNHEPLDLSADSMRFDCLRLMHATTHMSMTVEKDNDVVTVKLFTRNKGLMNVMIRIVAVKTLSSIPGLL